MSVAEEHAVLIRICNLGGIVRMPQFVEFGDAAVRASIRQRGWVKNAKSKGIIAVVITDEGRRALRMWTEKDNVGG